MKKKTVISLIAILFVFAASAPAAFIVEPHPTGLASDHFYHNGVSSPTPSTPSNAAGLTASNSVFGGSASTEPDTYVFSYTPGADVDNWDVPAYTYFGNGLYTTNQEGGQTGYYNVYITWPTSTNVSSLSDIIVTNDGADVVWTNIDQDDNGTIWLADQWDHDPLATLYGGNHAWLKIADEVLLTAGQTYTVSQVAYSNTYVSLRSAGVMWEFVAVPEPMSLLLLGAGGLLLRRRS